MEVKLKAALGLSVVKSRGSKHGGCISEGNVYETENGLIFVKTNKDSKAHIMFEGEVEGLKAIQNTYSVKVPKPMTVLNLSNGTTAVVMEYIDMKSLSNFAEKLGEQLARMHLHNKSLKHVPQKTEDSAYVDRFGFHVTTCCGQIPQDNSWHSDWISFFSQQRLYHQIKLVESGYGDREASELWSQLSLIIPRFFRDIEITPSLLHGDLWSGNAAQTDEGPVIFDPAVFYGHSEYELSIAEMFGGFPRSFYGSYHGLLPKQDGFEKRQDLYKLFHCLNHW